MLDNNSFNNLHRNKAPLKALLLLVLCLTFMFLPYVKAQEYTELRYCTTDVLPLNRPHLKLSNSAFAFAYETNFTFAFGSPQSEYGIRAFIYFSNGSTSEITAGTPEAVVIRTVDGQGFQSAIYNATETNTTKDASVYIELWTRLRNIPFGGTVWTMMTGGGYTNFQTEPLGALLIQNAIWNMTYYSYRLKVGNLYTHRVWFGNSSHYTTLDNLVYTVGEDNITAMAPFFFLGALVFVVIGALIFRKRR